MYRETLILRFNTAKRVKIDEFTVVKRKGLYTMIRRTDGIFFPFCTSHILPTLNQSLLQIHRRSEHRDIEAKQI